MELVQIRFDKRWVDGGNERRESAERIGERVAAWRLF